MKLKKILSVILAVMIVVVVPTTVSAETGSKYIYTVENGEAIITGFSSSEEGDIVIPDTLGGYPVTAIGDSALH